VALIQSVFGVKTPVLVWGSSLNLWCSKERIRLEIGIELEFNQSEKRKPVSGLVNFALIGQNPIQSQFLI